MQLDITTKEVFIKLQKGIKDKFDLDLSIQEIGAIYESQFQAGALGFKKRINIRLPYIGVFVDKGRKRKFKKNAELKKNSGYISEEEYAKALLSIQKEEKEQMTKAKSETTPASIEEIKKVDSIVNVVNVFDEVL